MTTEYDDGILKTLLESADEAIEVVDADIRFEYVNPAFERITGYDKAEIIGKTSAEILRPDNADPDLYERIVETIVSGSVWKGELVSRRKDGSLWLSEATISPIRDATGQITRYIAVRRDVTERKHAQAALRESEAQLRLVTDNLPVLIVYFDRDVRYRFINEVCEQWYARTRDNILGASVEEVLGREASQTLRPRLNTALAGQAVTFEDRVTYPDGIVRDVQVSYVPNFDLNGDVVGCFSLVLDITERKQAELELKESEERFRDMAELSADWFWEMDENLRFTYLSSDIAAIGVEPTEFKGKTPEEVMGKRYDPDNPDVDLLAMRSHKPFRGVERYSIFDPNRWIRVSGRPVFSSEGTLVGYRGTTSDITKHKHREDQLRHAQRMEAVGQLTGGIAHDFNNLLAVIMGHTEVLQEQQGAGNKSLRVIFKAADRGAALIEQLLTFSRQQPLEARAIDTGALANEIGDLLQRTLGETIEVETTSEPDLWHAQVDPGQLENAILNLALNARDAMSHGGKLSIAVSNTILDEAYTATHMEVSPGDYVLIAVNDNGAGMSEDVRAHAMEPFYTTKDVGEGSGLGLSMVYGFAKQSGGDLDISSEEGLGTTIKLYLPRADKSADRTDADDTTELPLGQGETVFVIEDDPEVCALVDSVLSSLGYRVLTAKDGRDGLEILKTEPRIDLLLSDVVLPGGVSGPDFAEEAMRHINGLKVMFMSGYAEGSVDQESPLPKDADLLNKPFLRRELAQRIRAALDS